MAQAVWSSEEEDLEDEVTFTRSSRTFKERINFQCDDFQERFRITRSQCEFLLHSIGHRLKSTTRRNYALSPTECLLVALRYFGTGGFFKLVGDAHGISDATVSRSVQKVVRAINEQLFDEFVRWPAESGVRNGIPSDFHSIAGMPRVCGCIDGTLIDIKAPPVDEDQYVDRHGNHSLNCMVVCGPQLQAYYVSARWPGRVADMRVLRNSDLYAAFEAGWRPFSNAIILGDSGYGLREWLIPPIGGSANDVHEDNFNRSHKKTRRIVECFFGVLKQRFQCLSIPLRVNPVYAGEIFKTCCVLQNVIVSDHERGEYMQMPCDEDLSHDNDLDASGPRLNDSDPRRRIILQMEI